MLTIKPTPIKGDAVPAQQKQRRNEKIQTLHEGTRMEQLWPTFVKSAHSFRGRFLDTINSSRIDRRSLWLALQADLQVLIAMRISMITQKD